VADPDNFRKWAFGVARLEALAWARDKARDRVVLSNDVLTVIADESDQIESTLSAQRQALEQCIEKLPPTDRALVLSSYETGSRVDEIAAQSGRTVRAFYQWLHRTRLRLLDCTQRTLQSEGVR
jgi:RNA polymerase sigma-70 factor (ECF subfamily)